MDNESNMFYCQRENNEQIIEQFLSELPKDTAALAFVSPIVRMQISPSQRVLPVINIPEEFGIEDAITAIKKHNGINKLFLLINSFGGGATSSYKIARMIRDNFDEITVFIPHMAASGGTVIALTGDKIIMGDMSSLTPTDVQISVKNGNFSVNTYWRAFKHFTELFTRTSEEDAPYTYKAMAEQLDPLELQECIDARKFSIKYAESILKHEKSSLSSRADRIIEEFHTGFPIHEYAITVENAKSIIGDDIVFHFKEQKFLNIWHCMRNWLRLYIMQESTIHFIRYILPEKSEKTDNFKKNKKQMVRGI